MTDSAATYRVQVLDRACDILECLAARGPELGVSEITDHLGLSKSTVHRILSVLDQREMVQRIRPTGKYILGIKLVELGSKAGSAYGLGELAGVHLKQLVEETGETAHLGVLRGDTVVSLSAVESPKTLRPPATVGRRSPAHSSSLGKCMLADLSPDELEKALKGRELERFTPKTIVTLSGLLDELLKVRSQGYAVDDEEFEYGLKCIGAPIHDRSGHVIAAVSIAGPSSRLGPVSMKPFAAAVRRVASEISDALGYRPKEVPIA